MGAVADFVGDVFGGVVDFVGDVVEAVGDVVSDVVEVVGDVIEYVAENPEVVAIAIAAPYAISAVGAAAGVSASTISLATQPITAGLITASQGGDLEDIGKSMVGSFIGQGIGGNVASSVGNKIGAAGNTLQTALANGVGGAAGSAAGALVVGGDVGKAAIAGGLGSAGASLARSTVAEQFGLDPRSKAAEFAADVGEAGGRTVAGGNLGQELLQAGLSTVTREGQLATRDLLSPTDADIKQAVAQQNRTFDSAQNEINEDITNALSDRKNSVQVAFQGPVTAEILNQIARNASLDLIETWKAKAAADPVFARALAQPEVQTAMRAAGMAELALAVGSLTSVAAGGLAASALGTGQLAAPGAEVVRRATQENMMLGAMGGDATFAGALLDVWQNTPVRTATATSGGTLPEVVVEAKIEPQLTPQEYKSSIQRYIGDFAETRSAELPVTADVARVAQILNVTNAQAAALRNSPIFEYLTNPSANAKAVDIDTLPLRERAIIEYAAANKQGGVSLSDDFNVIIPGKTTQAPVIEGRRTTTTATQTKPQTQAQMQQLREQQQAGTQTGTRTRTGTQTATQTEAGTETGTRTQTGTQTVPGTETETSPAVSPSDMTGSDLINTVTTETGAINRGPFRPGMVPDSEEETGGRTDTTGAEGDLVEEPISLSDLTDEQLIELLRELYPTEDIGKTTEDVRTGTETPTEDFVVDARTAGSRRRGAVSISPRVVGTSPVAAVVSRKEPIFGGEPDPQRDVWNVRSLRLRKALGL
jgi:hypothetical protein